MIDFEFLGILGSALMGGKLGTIFARAGHEVVFSYARSKRKLEMLAREAQGNARAGTPGEAAKDAHASFFLSRDHNWELSMAAAKAKPRAKRKSTAARPAQWITPYL